jgi:hypothetical protein
MDSVLQFQDPSSKLYRPIIYSVQCIVYTYCVAYSASIPYTSEIHMAIMMVLLRLYLERGTLIV